MFMKIRGKKFRLGRKWVKFNLFIFDAIPLYEIHSYSVHKSQNLIFAQLIMVCTCTETKLIRNSIEF